MSYVTLRHSSYSSWNGANQVGGGSLGDQSDSSWLQHIGSGQTYSLSNMTDYTLASNERCAGVQLGFRADSGFGAVVLHLFADGATSLQYDNWGDVQGLADRYGQWRVSTPAGGEWDQTAINGLKVWLVDDGYGGTKPRVTEVWATLDIRHRPTTTAAGPTGTNPGATRSPTSTWTYGDIELENQASFQVKIFSEAQYTAGGFDPATSTATYDSGIRSGNVRSHTIETALADGNYRSYVRGSKTFRSSDWWADWTYTSFTINDTPNLPTGVTPANGATVQTDMPTMGATIAASPLSTPSAVQFQFASDSGFTTNVKTVSSSPNVVSGAVSVAVPNDTNRLDQRLWYLRARTVDSTGKQSGWSATQSFTVSHTPTAGNLTPTGDQTLNYGTNGAMTLDWDFADPAPEGDVQTAYQVIVERNDTAAQVWDSGKLTSSNTFHAWKVPGAEVLDTNTMGLEGGIGSWSALSNCVVAQSATFAATGTQSLRMSSSAAGTMTAATPSGLSGFPVLAGVPMTIVGKVRGAIARTSILTAFWYKADGTASSTASTQVGSVTSTTVGFTTISASVTPPTDAAFCRLVPQVQGTAGAGELHYWDDFSLKPTTDLRDIPLRWKVRVYDADDKTGGYSANQLFRSSAIPQVVINEPDEFDIVSSPTPTFDWTTTLTAGRTRAAFRVEIGNYGSTPGTLYDSGWISSSAQTYTVPSSVLVNGQSYTARISVRDSVALEGTATLLVFSAQWDAPKPIVFTVDPTAHNVGGYIELEWPNTVKDAQWLRYNVYRRRADVDGADWELVGSTDLDLVTYTFRDYLVASGVPYEHAVTQVATRFGVEVESVKPYDNRVFNPGFELSAGGWALGTGSTIISGDGSEGTKCLEIADVSSGTGPVITVQDSTPSYNVFPVTAGEELELHVDVKPISTDPQAVIEVVFDNGSGLANGQHFGLPAGWSERSISGVVPAGRDRAAVRLATSVIASQTGTVRFDNIKVYSTVDSTTITTEDYWLVDPVAEESVRLFHVTSDSFTDEYEEETMTLIGRGRHVEYGTRLGYAGQLQGQFWDFEDVSARTQRLTIELMKRLRNVLYLKNAFGDVFKVDAGGIQFERMAGVGTREYGSYTISYQEVD